MERLIRSKRLASRGGRSRWKVASPQEIEEGIKSKAVTWDPFTVLPKEIYLMIFNLLESNEDKRNFMNAHIKFYDLFKFKRVLFLFEHVYRKIVDAINDEGDLDSDSDADEFEEDSNCLRCRLVCRDWDNGIQNNFQLDKSYFMIDRGDFCWTPMSSVTPTYLPATRDFAFPSRVDKKLEEFSVTHPPSKNPILSRSITLKPFCYVYGMEWEEVNRLWSSVDAFLERYGQHIWHCRIVIEKRLDSLACNCIGGWIDLMPELKTLDLKVVRMAEVSLKHINSTQVIQSEMKKLVLLNSSYLPAIVFNKLFGNLPELRKIQIKYCRGEESFLRNFDMKIKREMLEEAFLTIKGLEDFEYLKGSQPFPNLRKLVTALEFKNNSEKEDKAYSNYPEWQMIFRILEEKFPAVEDLTLRLPKAVCVKNKKKIIDQSLKCRLNLPNLKGLWVALPNLCSIDFLENCKELEELHLVLEHSAWNLQSSKDLGRRERIEFNVDLRNMWESNIWRKFPELRKLKIKAWRDFGRSNMLDLDDYTFDIYAYEKSGEKRSYSECKLKSKQF